MMTKIRACLFLGGYLMTQLLLLHFYIYSSSTILPIVQRYLTNASNVSSSSSSSSSVNTTTSPNITKLSEINIEVLRQISLPPAWTNASEKVAIIVPYRRRLKHLLNFLTRILPFLGRQRKQYVLIVTEQAGDEAFNRAKLFNVAIREIRQSAPGDRLHGIECFILHDVDKIPTSPFILYECGQNVRQLVTAFRSGADINRLYPSFLGAATAFSWDHVEKMNGASNLFTGWGGEDDELLVRLKLNDITVDRVSDKDGVFDEFDAKHAREQNADRITLLGAKHVKARWRNDGIKQTHYKVLNRINYDQFVWLLVSI